MRSCKLCGRDVGGAGPLCLACLGLWHQSAECHRAAQAPCVLPVLETALADWLRRVQAERRAA